MDCVSGIRTVWTVCQGSGRYVAVGAYRLCVRAQDGTDCVSGPRTVCSSRCLQTVCQASGRYVAVGAYGLCVRAQDGM